MSTWIARLWEDLSLWGKYGVSFVIAVVILAVIAMVIA